MVSLNLYSLDKLPANTCTSCTLMIFGQSICTDKVTVDCKLIWTDSVLKVNIRQGDKKAFRVLRHWTNLSYYDSVGDMLTTAISVARNCAMVGQRDRVVMLKASQPNDNEVSIEYELDESNLDTTPEHSDFDNEVTFFIIVNTIIFKFSYFNIWRF